MAPEAQDNTLAIYPDKTEDCTRHFMQEDDHERLFPVS